MAGLADIEAFDTLHAFYEATGGSWTGFLLEVEGKVCLVHEEADVVKLKGQAFLNVMCLLEIWDEWELRKARARLESIARDIHQVLSPPTELAKVANNSQ